MYAVCMRFMPVGPEEGVRYPGAEATDSCEPPHRSWETNAAPL